MTFFYEGLERPIRKVKGSMTTMEKILSTMLLYKHVYGADIRLATMSGTLVNNILEKWLGVIRRGTHQAVSIDIRWEYEPLSNLWLDIYPDSCSSDDG